MTIRLQIASETDLTTLLPLMERFYTHFGYPYVPVVQQQVVTNFLAHPDWGSLWLLEDDGQAVGYVALTYGFTFEFQGRDAFVDELFILDSHRNQGAGSYALQFIQQQASALGLVAIHLQTEAYNSRARKLYEQLGFVDGKRQTLTWRIRS